MISLKKIMTSVVLSAALAVPTGCGAGASVPGSAAVTQKGDLEKFTFSNIDLFDTKIDVIAYAKSREEFDGAMKVLEDEYRRLHKLYDFYRTYPGVNNIMTINENAGKEPVAVDKDIIDLLEKSREYYEGGHNKTNLAMGAVLIQWHDFRERYIGSNSASGSNTEETEIPKMEDLKAAVALTDPDDVVIDREKSTVFLKKPGMRLDVGAFAKGYATELVAQKLKSMGLEQAMISAGGNIKIVGAPELKDKKDWAVGIQNPDVRVENVEPIIDLFYLKSGSVVSSGDYERFYMYNGEIMHHIIDPDTLMPGRNFRQVTVVTEDSGKADFFSTALFLMTYEEGLKVAGDEGLEVLWVFPDGSMKNTPGLDKFMKSKGAQPAKE